MIRKEGTKWCLYTKDGSRKLGCHDTEEEALAQEEAIKIRERDTRSWNGGLRSFKALQTEGEVRTEMWQGREHIVVPVIALVEGVIHAINSASAELVLAEEFTVAPQIWNGRPVMPDHPTIDGVQVSANDPRIYEEQALGFIWNAKAVDKKLTMEAWIDVARAKLTELGRNLLRRIAEKKPIEVSVGTYVSVEPKVGLHNGKRYAGVWRGIMSDHVALLPENATGACSIEMGCGVRAARGGGMGKGGAILALAGRLNTWFEDLVGKRHSSQDQAMLQDIHDRAVELGADCAGDRYESRKDEFATLVSKLDAEKLKTLKEGALKVAQDAHPFTYCMEHVIPAIQEAGGSIDDQEAFCAYWKAEYAAARNGECGCHKKGDPTLVKNLKERVAALIASKKNPFTEVQRPFLETCSEEQLKNLEDADEKAPEPKEDEPKEKAEEPKAAARRTELIKTLQGQDAFTEDELKKMPLEALEKVVKVAGKKVEEPRKEPEARELTEEEWTKTAPPSVREMFARHKATDEAKKNELIASLKDNGAYSEAELKTMSMPDLEKIAKLAGKQPNVDFSLLGVPRQARDKETEVPPPPDVNEAIRAARSAKQKTA